MWVKKQVLIMEIKVTGQMNDFNKTEGTIFVLKMLKHTKQLISQCTCCDQQDLIIFMHDLDYLINKIKTNK